MLSVDFQPPILYAKRLIQVPRCSPLLEAKDGVEPSFQDLQSDTFPLCYLAKPATAYVEKEGEEQSFYFGT